ncbi:MAG: class I SAM-dependent methyltransferase [Deltaproteobacteria bacterium]|nr:MAG: class I SAM-dependent methyltransferase [Deltaproteobacteria bacterium]
MRLDVDRLRRDIVFRERLRDAEFEFRTTWGLFSPRGVDEGSRLLARHLEIHPGDDCLDLGCGYGPIGLVMARCAPAGTTFMVDKDFVAVEYAAENARRNGLENCRALLSNGFDQLPREQRFDVIAANLPAKVGKELLAILLCDARARLRDGGRLYVVTISGLRRFIERALREVFGNYEKVKQGKSYTVALARVAAACGER